MKDRLLLAVNAHTQKRSGFWYVSGVGGYWRLVCSGWRIRQLRRDTHRAEARAAKRRKAKR